MSILSEIVERSSVDAQQLVPRRGDLEELLAARSPIRPFRDALIGSELSVIAEIKRRSPSKGVLCENLDAGRQAAEYLGGGASALSVLTNEPYFDGRVSDLTAAREETPLPVLRKDFIVEDIQVLEAAAIGADAMLLIVAGLPDLGRLRALREQAEEFGLAVLVEADDEAGVETALECGATLIGVTNRNLRDFGEDLTIAERVRREIPNDCVAVAESAVRTVGDAERMATAGYDAVLVGEAFVRSTDPAALVRAMASVPHATRGEQSRHTR